MTASAAGFSFMIARIVLRALLFLAVVAAITFVPMADDDGLGTGLLAFAVQATLALILGLVDGYRRPQPQTMLEWATVAVLGTVLGSIYLALPIGYDEPWTWSTISAGLTTQLDPVSLPFMIGLIAVPGLVGVTLGWVSGRLGGASAGRGSADVRLPG